MTATSHTVTGTAVSLSLALALALASTSAVVGQHGARQGEWRHYGADAGSTKYSPIDQIDRDNVHRLEIAWRWKTLNFGPKPDYNFRATPLMVDGALYVTAGSRRIAAAIDAVTGETLWIYRPEEPDRAGSSRSSSGRGLAYWSDGEAERILYVTRSFRLISLDAATGVPDPAFGVDGIVDLHRGLGREVRRGISSTSPPMIVAGTVVVGSSMPISLTKLETAPGHVRGFDPRTGEQRWIFHTIPQEAEYGNETWENDSWTYSGNVGVWSMMAADEELGYVYLPLETPPNDYYGGHRLGDNLFAESLVCLDARTGERVWHFQAVHHGIFDYDFPAPPVLLDIEVDGRPVKAVAQVSKQAFTYVFDRVTGEPVWPIEEREVEASTIPGERSSPTQPFPSKPPPFDRQGIGPDDLIDFTPELRAEAREILEQYHYGPLYTPPTLFDENGKKGTIQLPGTLGGANWPGASADPETGLLYVASSTDPQIIAMTRPDPSRSEFDWVRTGSMRVTGPQGLPLTKPPWGRITAIDLNRGEIAWTVANGEAPAHVREHPALEGIELSRTGHGGRGGTMVTKTLLFAGEGSGLYNSFPGSGGPMFRAYDKATGEVIWETELPAHQSGVPMTYTVDGRQYIAVAIGARDHPAELVALTLP